MWKDPRTKAGDPRGPREKHPLYKIWNWHKKRNRYGMVPEWADDFWAFVAGVGERPSSEHRLRRKEIKQPIGPDNFFWDEKYAHGNADNMTKEQRAAYMREYRKRRPRNVRNAELRSRFGITLEDYERMYEEQGGVCAICGGRESDSSGRYINLTVDHCHGSGDVRGLLCNLCNRGIGMFGDDPDIMRRAAEYVS